MLQQIVASLIVNDDNVSMCSWSVVDNKFAVSMVSNRELVPVFNQ